MNAQDPIKSKRVPRFVEEYCKDRNGTQAAIRAGYTSNVEAAGVTAARLLSDTRVQGLIEEPLFSHKRFDPSLSLRVDRLVLLGEDLPSFPCTWGRPLVFLLP